MPHKQWVKKSLKELAMKDEHRWELVRFWNEFYEAVAPEVDADYGLHQPGKESVRSDHYIRKKSSIV